MELSYKKAVSFGWDQTKELWKLLLVYGLVIALIQVVVNVLIERLGTFGSLFSMPISFFLSFVNVAFVLFLIDRVGGNVGLKESMQDFWVYLGKKFNLIVKFILLQLLTMVVFLVALLGLGLVVAIPLIIGQLVSGSVGGVFVSIAVVLGLMAFGVLMILMLRLQWSTYLLVDKGMGAKEALKTSWEITRGKEIWLLGWVFVSLGIILLGILALVVGVLVAAAVLMLAMAWIYRQMDGGKVMVDRTQVNRTMPRVSMPTEPMM